MSKRQGRSPLRVLAEGIQAQVARLLAQLDGEPLPDVPTAEGGTSLIRALALDRLWDKVWDAINALDYEDEDGWHLHWLHNLYLETDGTLFAVIARDGGLFKAAVTVDGETVTLGALVQVIETFTPVRSRTSVVRRADGSNWWVSISCSAVLNRVGEIDSRALFRDFEARFNAAEAAGADRPIRQLFHEGEALRTGEVRAVFAEDNLLVTAGVFDDTVLGRAEAAAIAANPDYYGESIGYEALAVPANVEIVGETGERVRVRVYDQGQLMEVSGLPRARAAALFTMPQVIQKDRTMARQETIDFLQQIGADAGMEDEVGAFIEALDETNRSIDRAAAGGALIRREDADAAVADEVIADAADLTDGTDSADDVVAEARSAEPVQQLGGTLEIDEDALGLIVDGLLAHDGFQAALAAVSAEAAATAAAAQVATAVAAELAPLREALTRLQTRLDASQTTGRRDMAALAEQVLEQLAPSPMSVHLVAPRRREAAVVDSADDNGEQTPATRAQKTLAELGVA